MPPSNGKNADDILITTPDLQDLSNDSRESLYPIWDLFPIDTAVAEDKSASMWFPLETNYRHRPESAGKSRC